MNVRVVDFATASSTEIDAIKEVLNGAIEASVFHSIEWLTFLHQQFEARPKILIAFDGQSPIGLLPYFEAMLEGEKSVVSGGHYLGTVYGGPVVIAGREGARRILLGHFAHIPARRRLLHTVPDFPDVELRKSRFKSCAFPTSIFDLTPSEEEIWRNVEKRFRNSMRKAQKNGVTIADGKPYLLEFGRLLEATAQEKGFSILPGDPQKTYSAMCEGDRLGKSFVALMAGKVIGGVIVLLFKDKMYFYLGAFDREAPASPNTLLHWEAIRWAKMNSLCFYDLLVLAAPGPAMFKGQLNGRLTTFYIASRTPILKRLSGRIITLTGRIYQQLNSHFVN